MKNIIPPKIMIFMGFEDTVKNLPGLGSFS
jgi:hypothetical protein